MNYNKNLKIRDNLENHDAISDFSRNTAVSDLKLSDFCQLKTNSCLYCLNFKVINWSKYLLLDQQIFSSPLQQVSVSIACVLIQKQLKDKTLLVTNLVSYLNILHTKDFFFHSFLLSLQMIFHFKRMRCEPTWKKNT